MDALTTFGTLLGKLTKIGKDADKRALITLHCVTRDSMVARLWKYSLSPYITFGLKEIPKEPVNTTSEYAQDSAGLVSLLDDLAARRLTGGAAKNAVRAYFDGLSNVHARRGFQALITKKPRCGVAAGLLNSIWQGWIPTFEVMRARPWHERLAAAMFQKAAGAIVEVKMDGERHIYIHGDKSSQFLTRGGLEQKSFPYIVEWLDANTTPGTVLDGELVVNGGRLGTREELSTHIGSTIVNESMLTCPVRFSVFDVMSVDHWNEGCCPIHQHWRTAWLEQHEPFRAADSPVFQTPSYRLFEFDSLHVLYTDLVQQGYEGVIIKSPTGHYLAQSSAAGHWMKRKFEAEEDVTILDVLPGDKGGKFEFTLGRFWCRRKNGHNVFVGRGRMDTKLGEWFWHNRDDMPGQVIEILHNGETEDGSLLHPRFKRHRPDKAQA